MCHFITYGENNPIIIKIASKWKVQNKQMAIHMMSPEKKKPHSRDDIMIIKCRQTIR